MSALNEKQQTASSRDRLRNGQPTRLGLWLLVVFALALIMGAPSLRGGFLGGDDVQLVRDHVLVNRPSIEHAVKLFGIIHRDLYQPVAMLSFSLDFVVVRLLGYPPESGAHPAGVWVFHLTNVLLHAVNAMLVAVLIACIARRRDVAVVAGLLFAIHPFCAEPVAWVSGRMMLLSTTFLLATLIQFDGWSRSRHGLRLGLALLFAALCMMSKVRVSLPALAMVPLIYQRRWPSRRWWIGWSALCAITVIFAAINAYASRGMIERGAEQLTGPRVVRTLSSLAWYLTHFAVPVSLSPYHPVNHTVHWSDAGVLQSAMWVALVLGATLISWRRSRLGGSGMLWFLASIAVTLPLVPMRNLLVAERYAYLPIVGLCWIVAGLVVQAHRRIVAWHRLTAAGLATVVGLAAAAALVGASWHSVGFYVDDVSRAARFSSLYADFPLMRTKYGWSLYDAGRYREAIVEAEADLKRFGSQVEYDARQLIGMSQFRLGQTDDAIATLKSAIAADPDGGIAQMKLATLLRELGRVDEAIKYLRVCTTLLPNENSALLNLAELLRQKGELDQAAEAYHQILDNNPYDVQAIMALAELDIRGGRHQAALDRLDSLLDWMPDNVVARTNAGVCLAVLGRLDEAIQAYRTALNVDPQARNAVINLVSLLIETGQRQEADQQARRYLDAHPADRDLLLIAARNLLDMGHGGDALGLWRRGLRAEPDAADLRGWYAWTLAMLGQWVQAQQAARISLAKDEDEPVSLMVTAAAVLRSGQPQRAIEMTDRLVKDGTLSDAYRFDTYCALLQAHCVEKPDDAWPYFVLAKVCKSTGRDDAARLAGEEFKKRVHDPQLIERIDMLIDAKPAGEK